MQPWFVSSTRRLVGRTVPDVVMAMRCEENLKVPARVWRDAFERPAPTRADVDECWSTTSARPTATLRSIQDRGQERALWLVVGAVAHERHQLYDTQPVRCAPVEHLDVARRQQEPRPTELRSGSDQRL